MPSVAFRLSSVATVLLALASAAPASATTVEVGTCLTGLVQFNTIQTAVNQSPAGTVIDVCPGIYSEQVAINKNLTLKGVADPNSNQDAAIIVPPGGGVVANSSSLTSGQPIAAQILVTAPATSVSLTNLTVDGAGNGIQDCATNLIGIYYQNASGTVNTSVLRNQALVPADSGCQSGLGVFVQSGNNLTSTVTVENTSVHNYQKNGITGNEPGTTLNAVNDFVEGLGVVNPPGAAQNGIQIGFGAKGKVTGSTVIDQVYGDANIAGSVGILLYDAATSSGINIASNNVGNTQTGVGLYTDSADPTQYGDGVIVQSNRVYETLNYDAIDVCTNANTIRNNIVLNSAEAAIRLDSLCSGGGNNTGNSNTVSGNNMLESACAGILQDSGTSNTIGGGNNYFDIPFTLLTGSCPAVPSHRSGKGLPRTKIRPIR